VRFGLPSANPEIFQAKADVVWNDAFAMGYASSVSSPDVVQVSRLGWILWRHKCNSGSQPNRATRYLASADRVGRVSTSHLETA